MITTVIFCAILLALIGSVLQYSVSERRFNNRAKILYETRTATESISEYGIAQVKNILESNRTFTDSTWSASDQSMFVTGGTYAGMISLPPDTFWMGGHIVPSTGPSATQPLMHVGKILDTQGGGLKFIDPTNPNNAGDPLKGKKVFNYALDVLSRATAVDPFGGGTLTKYMQQTYNIRAVPLFANAVYYNMDLEVQPGPNMTITGSTHTNGRLFPRSASAAPIAITFAGPVTAVKGIWTNFHTPGGDNLMPFFQSINDSGALQTNATTGIVQILPAGSTVPVPLCLTTATTGFSPSLPTGTWVESTWELHPPGETWQQHVNDSSVPSGTYTETADSKLNFANWLQQTYSGNVLTNVNNLVPNVIQGIPDYIPAYGSLYPDPNTGTADSAYTYMTASGNDTNNSAHALIETPRLSGAASYNQGTESIKYAHNVALYIVANTTASATNGHQPDGTLVSVAAKSYRAFMNDTTTIPYTITEIILPGQDTYGNSNTSTNPYTTHKNARPVVQMYNIDFNTASLTFNQEITTAQRRMTDMRRTAGGDPGNDLNTTFDHAATRSITNVYVPKNLYMIDIDMTELKKAVQTIAMATGTTAITTGSDFYVTGIPTVGNFLNHIYNQTATPTNVTLSDDTRIITTNAATLTNAFTTAIWNGAVYVESIAADSFNTVGATASIRKAITHEMHNSGVRLINGRGKVPSIPSSPGFTLATNDAVYVLGTFNADGDPATPAMVAVTVPPSPGASTGHNYEPGELPASIAADAVTLLSEPFCVNISNTISQTTGWNDAFSGYTYSTTSYSNSWSTIPPSGSNTRDGIRPASAFPYQVPYDSSSGAWTSGNSDHKYTPAFSEYSFAMLCGLVPTGKNGVNQTSGGLHNFPRFLEGWGGVECRIRGSMVALFECRVADEPWNLRVYSPPLRVWGFNLLYDTGVMPPLTPKTISFRRSYENDISKATYNTKLTAWGYPTLP